MWYLTSSNDERVIYLTPNIGKITIGRSVDPGTCDFPFPEDTSISRKHACLSLSGDQLVLTDLGSKYGTFICKSNDENAENSKVDVNVAVILQEGNIIKFGIIDCEWRVNRINLVTCASTVKGENLINLKEYVAKLGGIFKNEWDETCTFLTMPAITLTIKVVLALVQGAQIVTLDFWVKCCDAIKNKNPLPDPNKFTPEVIESTLNKEIVSFAPNMKRKTIFAGKRFIFFSKRQLDMYGPILKLGSAIPLLLGESKLTKSSLVGPDVIVIQYIIKNTSQESQNQQIQIESIVSYLKTKGKRVIADAEIGLAILYCSLEKYCNPDFNFSSEVMKQNSENQNAKKANVLVQESQESIKKETNLTSTNAQNCLINESLTQKITNVDEDMGVNTSAKRKFNGDDQSGQNAQKKLATDKNIGVDPSQGDFFNFIDQGDDEKKSEDNNNKKKLNFSKPGKRKQGDTDNDDNLFNFVPSENDGKNTAVNVGVTSKIFDKSITNSEQPVWKKPKIEKIDIKPVIPKLSVKELLENSKTWKNTEMIPEDGIKKEILTTDLEDQMNDLSLGTTIVIINKDLVVDRKETFQVDAECQGKNFKKFKKVWPVKMQITVIPRSSMTVVEPTESNNENQANLVTSAPQSANIIDDDLMI